MTRLYILLYPNMFPSYSHYISHYMPWNMNTRHTYIHIYIYFYLYWSFIPLNLMKNSIKFMVLYPIKTIDMSHLPIIFPRRQKKPRIATWTLRVFTGSLAWISLWPCAAAGELQGSVDQFLDGKIWTPETTNSDELWEIWKIWLFPVIFPEIHWVYFGMKDIAQMLHMLLSIKKETSVLHTPLVSIHGIQFAQW